MTKNLEILQKNLYQVNNSKTQALSTNNNLAHMNIHCYSANVLYRCYGGVLLRYNVLPHQWTYGSVYFYHATTQIFSVINWTCFISTYTTVNFQ